MDIMIDLETLSTRPNAVILQIGAVAFDPSMYGRVGPSFAVNVDIQSCLDMGLVISGDTLMWWMDEDRKRALQSIVAGYPPRHLAGALDLFNDWVRSLEFDAVWANGAAFDFPIIENAYRATGLAAPWTHRQVRDMRTLRALYPDIDRVEPTLPHNAVSDARAQALFVQSVLGVGGFDV